MAGSGLGYEILGAVKVKDGLFIGDELAAQDLEFVVSNKVTRIINCCGRQVPNHWESIGVVYLTYYWVDADNQVILDQRDVVGNEIARFVEEALAGAESVLIHSVRGQSRSCCVLSAYMMKKHSWGLRKTMEFLSFRRPDMNLKPAFLQQLSGYERRLMAQATGPFSLDWSDADFSRLESEELLLRNTYINSQMGPLAEFHANDGLPAKPRRLMWTDADRDDKLKLEKPAGADRVQVTCGQNGQPMPPRGVIKKTVGAGGGGGGGGAPNGVTHAAIAGAVQGGPQPGLVAGGVPGGMPGPPGGMQPGMGGMGGGFQDHGANWGAGFSSENPEVQHPPPAKAAAAAAAAAAAVAGLLGGYSGGYPGSGGPPEVVPTAWGEQPMKDQGQYAAPGSGGYAAEAQRMQGGYQQRGPATNIRDSLQGQQRRDSPEPSRVLGGGNGGSGSRPPSRDPSPKTGPGARRGESPSQRGKPPLRYFSPSSQGRGPATSGAYPAAATSGNRGSMSSSMGGGYPGYQGLSIGGVRSGPGSASAPGAPPGASSGSATPPPGGGPNGGGPRPPGMGAFRSGGPVRAKADLLGAPDGSLRRSRPATAPSARSGSNSRPASPVGGQQRSGSNSRPASPHTSRAGGGSSSAPPAPMNRGPPLQGMSYPHAQTHRSVSGHMRRAPSPTPAFNRNASPSKPRWRA